MQKKPFRCCRTVSAIATVAALATGVAAFEIGVADVVPVASAAAGGHLWMPHSAVALDPGQGRLAVLLSTGPFHCRHPPQALAEGDDEVERPPLGGAAAGNCGVRAAMSVDGGVSFQLAGASEPSVASADGVSFCGAAGVPLGGGLLRCVSLGDSATIEEGGAAVKLKAADFGVTAAGDLTAAAVPGGVTVDFTVAPVTAVLATGDNALHFADRNTTLLAVDVRLANGTRAVTLIRSDGTNTAGTAAWRAVSVVVGAVPGTPVRLQRGSDTKVLCYSGPAGKMLQVTSLYMGTKWRAVQEAPAFMAPVADVASRHGVTLVGGLTQPPALKLVALTSVKNSTRELDIGSLHSQAAAGREGGAADEDAWPADGAAAAGLPASCAMPNGDLRPAGPDAAAAGCITTGHVALVAFGENSTAALAIYDTIHHGGAFHAAAAAGGHRVFALRLMVNETAEVAALQKDIENAEALRKAREELEVTSERERRKVLEKKRLAGQRRRMADGARRAAFEAADGEALTEARAHVAAGTEPVVVRVVDDEFEDVERHVGLGGL